MGARYLIDTNVIIDFAEGRLPQKAILFISEVVNDSPALSFVNKIELLGFHTVPEVIIDFVDEAFIESCSDEIIDRCIQIRKGKKIKLPDAIIASTALATKRILLTRNTADFLNIEGLDVINPHDIE